MINKKIIIGSVAAVMLTGCASAVVNTAALTKSQQAYEKIQHDSRIQQYAVPSLFQAGKLYRLSKQAEDASQADHLAYLLDREVGAAKESAAAKELAVKLEELKETKTKALLDAKENELLQAKEEARRAKEAAQGLEQKYQQLQELNAKMTDRGLVLTLGDVLFGSNKATLMRGGMRAVEKLADFLAENETRKVLIEGHTDNVGSSSYNLDLSLRRAESVANALITRGIDKSRIVTKGYGEQYPVTSNDSAAGKQQNRRVEIVILNEGDKLEDVLR